MKTQEVDDEVIKDLIFMHISGFDLNGKGRSIIANLKSSLLIAGDDRRAYRDPAVFIKDEGFHLYMTAVEKEADGKAYWYVAHTTSKRQESPGTLRL